MTSLFLAPMQGQLFAFPKEWVVGVGGRNVEHNRLTGNEQKFLRLPTGERANIFHFRDLLDNRFSVPLAQLRYYLILHYRDTYAALSIEGRGQWASVLEPSYFTLPPCFSKRSRQMIPHILLNGHDILLMPDMDALFALMASQCNDGNSENTAPFFHKEQEHS